MTEIRLSTAWLRSLPRLFALAGHSALSACGGGSGAPNNPYDRPTRPGRCRLPAAPVAYSGRTVDADDHRRRRRPTGHSRRTRPSCRSPQNVAGNTIVAAREQRRRRHRPSTHHDPGSRPARSADTSSSPCAPAPLLPASITIAPELGDVRRPTSARARRRRDGARHRRRRCAIAGRAGPLRRRLGHVLASSPPIPAQPLASTLTVVTDATGSAARDHPGDRQRADADRAAARHRRHDRAAADRPSSRSCRSPTATAILSVVPTGTTTITGAVHGRLLERRSVVDYYIFGGTPPYRVDVDVPGRRHAGQFAS